MKNSVIAILITLAMVLTPCLTLAGTRSLRDVAMLTADALAAEDTDILQENMATYEELATVSKKIKRRTSEEYKKERDETINEMWRDVRQAKLMVDHVEIEDVIILSKSQDATPSHVNSAFGVVLPVFIHQDREIRSPMMRMFFIHIDGKWKYSYGK